MFRKFWFFVTRWRRMEDLDEEMRLHVEMRAAANKRRGLPQDEATREAKRRFGSQLKLREESRDAWGFSELERVGGDLRYAVRQLASRPAWTLVVVLTLALGIGANTSIFTLLDTLLFKPAPWNTAGRLVWISSVRGRGGRAGSVSYPDYVAYRDRTTMLSGVMAFGGNGLSVGGAHPQRVNGGLVSGNYFDLVGIHAAMGRTFAPDEDAEPGAHPVTVISDAFWRTHFGADPRVVNSTVSINGAPFTIIGIAPAGFTGVAYADDPEQLWLPLSMHAVALRNNPGLLNTPTAAWLRVVGRLRDGATIGQADSEMRVIAGQLNPADTPPDREKGARVTAMRGGMTGWEQSDLGPVLGLIAIVPALVLLVACANVANVLMARNVSRRREFAMRRAIGASRGRLIRQLLTEALLLALLAAAAGFAVSFGLIPLIEHYGDVPTDFAAVLTPDIRALVATTALAMLTTVVFGLAPALAATTFEVHPALKDEGITSTAAAGRTRLRSAFVVAQVALSLALLIAAGLFLQSLSKAMRVDPGFDPYGAVTVSFDTSLQGYSAQRRDAFLDRLVERTSSLPGVTSTALASNLPLSGMAVGASIVPESTMAPARSMFVSVSPRYFETMRIPLVLGRDFSSIDAADAPLVAIVNETLSRRLWRDEDPLGQRFRVDDPKEAWREVVGVVRDAKSDQLTGPPRGTYYLPLRQHPESPMSLVVRAGGDSNAVLSSVVEIVSDLDRDLPVFQARTLDDLIRGAVRLRRAATSLFAVFGGLTLLLACMGIYGVSAHSVSLRTREVGIRMALGARAADVCLMFVRESLSLSFIGVAIGLAISVAVSKLLTTFLFGLTPTDAVTFIGASAILCLAAMVATFIPVGRAARVDPLVALRHE